MCAKNSGQYADGAPVILLFVLAQFFIIAVMGPGEVKMMSWPANLSIIVG